MIRIILWKIGFELSHLKRILWPLPKRRIYYFAFGANLSTDVLERRRIKVFESFDYKLENAVLRFSQSGFYKDHGYASADSATGEVTYGKMYLILQSDAKRMDYFEGVPFIGVHQKISQQIDGLSFFYYRSSSPREGLKPTKEYLNYLIDAYAQMSIVPTQYIESLSATAVLDQYLPQTQTGKYVRNINQWPGYIHPLLVIYERCCLRFIEFLWNRSLIHWMIK